MRRRFAFLPYLLLALAASCVQSTRPVPIPPERSPVPNTPVNAVRLLEWAWDHRNCEVLSPLFTDDFVFVFAIGDSAGNPYRSSPWTREDELAASCNLFQNAVDVQLDLDRTPVALPDDRPGKDPKWHKSIRTPVSLRVTIDQGGGPEVLEVSGFAKLYTVRGDSAAIPPDLVARGFGPDSTRWWFDRWEDETLPAGGSGAHPTQGRSWGAIKSLFR